MRSLSFAVTLFLAVCAALAAYVWGVGGLHVPKVGDEYDTTVDVESESYRRASARRGGASKFVDEAGRDEGFDALRHRRPRKPCHRLQVAPRVGAPGADQLEQIARRRATHGSPPLHVDPSNDHLLSNARA